MTELKDYTFFRFLAETKIRRKDEAVGVLLKAFDKTRLKISLILFWYRYICFFKNRVFFSFVVMLIARGKMKHTQQKINDGF